MSFVCSVKGCGKSYSHKSGVARHITCKHKEFREEQLKQRATTPNTLNCLFFPICTSTYCSVSNRNKHCRKQHNNPIYDFVYKCEYIQFIQLMEYQDWRTFLELDVTASGQFMASILRRTFVINPAEQVIEFFSAQDNDYTGLSPYSQDFLHHLIQTFLFRSIFYHIHGKERELLYGIPEDRVLAFLQIRQSFFAFTDYDWYLALQK